MLISRPTIQNHLVQNIAKAYKLERLERFKTLEEEAKKKSKRRVSKSAKPRPSVNSQFISIFDKASFHNSDYYLAEKQIWSFLKPYRIKATFVFVVTFPPEFCKYNFNFFYRHFSVPLHNCSYFFADQKKYFISLQSVM